MANTTISQLTPLTGTAVANNDLFLIYDASATAEKSISASELKNMVGNGAITITTSGTSDALIVTSTDNGATAAPDIVFFRNSASPATNDNIGYIVFRGKSSLAANVEYASIGSYIASPTSAAEKGGITFSTVNSGTFAERMRIRDDGGVGIGGTGGVNVGLYVQKNMTGSSSSYSVYAQPAIQSDVTTAAYVIRTGPTVANSAFTAAAIHHFNATQGAFGSSATVTNQYGFLSDGSLIGATNNYAFFAAAPTAANITTGKVAVGFNSGLAIATGGGSAWNFYAGGTAPNHFNGNVLVGTTTSNGSKLQVSGNVAITTTLSVTGNITGGAQIAGKYTALSNGTTAMALATNAVAKVTPTATATYTTTVAPAGSRATVIIVTSGTTSYTITFGTGFVTTGTLATGTVTAKTFAIDFVSDGTSMIETSRTTAM
jgi:hypothetical protein